jgi:hypothetical protein
VYLKVQQHIDSLVRVLVIIGRNQWQQLKRKRKNDIRQHVKEIKPIGSSHRKCHRLERDNQSSSENNFIGKRENKHEQTINASLDEIVIH